MTKDLTEQYEVGGTLICKEGSYVYTENGIEKVHYCQVGCITERVTPKSNIIAPVPSYDHFVELTEKDKENAKLKELLKECREVIVNGYIDYEYRAKIALKLYEVLK